MKKLIITTLIIILIPFVIVTIFIKDTEQNIICKALGNK